MRGLSLATGVAGDGTGDAPEVLEDALDAPEASAGEDRDLGRCLLSGRRVERRGRIT